MFDIGFWELAVLGVIALIVLGPERLPVVARTMGQWVSRAKGYMNAITSELEREVKADEIRKDVQLAREQIESETRNVHNETRKSVEPVMKPLDDNKPASNSAGAKSAAATTSQAASKTPGPVEDEKSGNPSASPARADSSDGVAATASQTAATPSEPAPRPDDKKHNAS